MGQLTHINARGEANMVDVGAKSSTSRRAVAEGLIFMQAKTLSAILKKRGRAKGDVLGVAQLAGIMAAKKTAELIPLCHPLMLTHVELTLKPLPSKCGVRCIAKVEATGPTGVEMEALQAVQTALLTVYDMCKSVNRGMTMGSIRLVEKTGGRSGRWVRDEPRQGRSVVLPGGERRLDYIQRRYYVNNMSRSAIRQEVNDMYGEDTTHHIAYQIVFVATRLSKKNWLTAKNKRKRKATKL